MKNQKVETGKVCQKEFNLDPRNLIEISFCLNQIVYVNLRSYNSLVRNTYTYDKPIRYQPTLYLAYVSKHLILFRWHYQTPVLIHILLIRGFTSPVYHNTYFIRMSYLLRPSLVTNS